MIDRLILWRIEGEACNGSNGGPMVIHAFSEYEASPPAPDLCLQATDPGYEWYYIDRIQCLGAVDLPWGQGGPSLIERIERLLK